MPFYVWWAIPVVATALAVVWLSWRARERQVDPHDSVAERRRFIAAMESPPVGRRPAPPTVGDEGARDAGSTDSQADPDADPDQGRQAQA